MLNKPVRIQLALQGGGAKLCHLLAFLDALQELSQKEKFTVTRIAGTSAGSIAACLLAANIQMPYIRNMASGMATNLCTYFPKLKWYSSLTNVLLGKPLWDPENLRRLFEQLFTQNQVGTLGDLKAKTQIEVHIIASDITNRRKVIYKEDSDPIVNSIMNSCAIPFFLRCATKGDHTVIVDGGICENLPIEDLQKAEHEYGPLIVVSFEDKYVGRSPHNAIDFSKALLDTAITQNTTNAKRSVEPGNIFVIATNIGTFDFEKALTEGLGDKYDLTKLKAKEFLESVYLASTRKDVREGRDVAEIWAHENRTLMKKIW
ncbi:MAG: patatin-like phospholipase family protein, partial [Nitrososphaera sp.]|nr:patatin-like phospholipase family protein [Nitrososphaera sp.]